MSKFTKVRYANKAVELVRVVRYGESTRETITHEGEEEPTPEFQKALAGFADYLPTLTGLPAEWLEKAVVVSVNMPLRKDDEMAFTISVKRPVEGSSSPLNMTTPLVVEHEGNIDEPWWEAIEELCVLAEGYIAGQYAQGELDLTPKRREGGADTDDQIDLEEQLRLERRDLEVQSAFVGALPFLPERGEPMSPDISDEDLATFIAEAWDDVAHEFEGTVYDGLFPHVTAESEVAWCYLVPGPSLSFHYGVEAPDEFDRTAAIPTLRDAEILARARRIYFGPVVATTEPAPQPEPEAGKDAEAAEPGLPAAEAEASPARGDDRVADVEQEPAARAGWSDADIFRHRTHPRAEPGKGITLEIVRQVLHDLLFHADRSQDTLYQLSQTGASDDQLATILAGQMLAATRGEPKLAQVATIGVHQNEKPLQYVDWTLTVGPPTALKIGKGKGAITMGSTEILEVTRKLLNIPVHDAPELAGVATAATDADALFAE